MDGMFEPFEDGHKFDRLSLQEITANHIRKGMANKFDYKYHCECFEVKYFPGVVNPAEYDSFKLLTDMFDETIASIEVIDVISLRLDPKFFDDELFLMYKIIKFLMLKYEIKTIRYLETKECDEYRLTREKLLNSIYLFFNINIQYSTSQNILNYSMLKIPEFKWRCYNQCKSIINIRTINIIYYDKAQFDYDAARFDKLYTESELRSITNELHETVVLFLMIMKRLNVNKDIVATIVRIYLTDILEAERSIVHGRSMKFKD